LPNRVRDPELPQASRRPSVGLGVMPRARHVRVDPELRRRGESIPAFSLPTRHPGAAKRVRYAPRRKPVSRPAALRNVIQQNLLAISVFFLIVGSVGWGLLLYNEISSSGLFSSTPHSVYPTVDDAAAEGAKSGAMGVSIAMRNSPAPVAITRNITVTGNQTSNNDLIARFGGMSTSIMARQWNFVAPKQDTEIEAPKTTMVEPPIRVATIDVAPPQIAPRRPALVPVALRLSATLEAKTSLVDFATAPFPYHGMVPGSNQRFLSSNEQGDRRHVNFRGRVFQESQTFNDDHVLLHIPAGFDPERPALMVVFFHGHGAILARDVRDRQQLPEQISAAGVNAVLVAPQFAVDAADSSAGKFWEPDGFKRFLGEAAQKLATLYGDPHNARTFANMPIVIVSYSGGFGPTLSILAQGGANSRIRGLVLLDSLYAGIDQFADWIANNRSAFFVSSYTPHTANHNADLEHMLAERSVPFASELRRNHLQGMVAFLPAGDVSHRDFVTHAWTDDPVADILARMDDVVPTIQTEGTIKPNPSITAVAFPRREED
jgi:hypothetical protein